MITLTVPDSVLSQALDKSLPIAIDTSSSTLSGAITIIRISNLQLQDKGVSCRIALKGDDMQLSTEISGHALKLKVGTVQLELQCNAALRFDPAKQILKFNHGVVVAFSPYSNPAFYAGLITFNPCRIVIFWCLHNLLYTFYLELLRMYLAVLTVYYKLL
jgi:hypothetical protein